MWFGNIFSKSVTSFFILLTGSFVEQIFLILLKSNLLIFKIFYGLWFSVISTLHLILGPKDFLLCFLLKVSWFLHFTFKLMTQFELILVQCVNFE